MVIDPSDYVSGSQLSIIIAIVFIALIFFFVYIEISGKKRQKSFAEKNYFQWFNDDEHHTEVENLISKTKLLSSLGSSKYQSMGSADERIFIFTPFNQAPMRASLVYWSRTSRPDAIIKFKTVSDKNDGLEGFERYYVKSANAKEAIVSANRILDILDEEVFRGIVEIAEKNLFVQIGCSIYTVERYEHILNLGREIRDKLSE